MSRNARILNAWPRPIFDQGVAMTDAARLDFDSHPSSLRLRNFSFNDFKRSSGTRNLNGTHFVRHTLPVASAGPASTPRADRSKTYLFSLFFPDSAPPFRFQSYHYFEN